MAQKVSLTPALRDEYAGLFQSCRVRDAAAAEVTTWAKKIADEKETYTSIGKPLGVPWYAIGIMHYRECSLSFQKHLHNGDPLTGRTVQVPPGRPKTHAPPFTFAESATDALTFNGDAAWKDWTLPGTLYRFEGYNGFGYRMYHSDVLSPYLWGKSNHYTKGGYPKDRVWSDAYVNKQLGSAVLLRRLSELGLVAFGADGSPQEVADEDEPSSFWSRYAEVRYRPNTVVALALELQQFLNRIPGIHVKEDGKAGQLTSDALKRVSGHRLKGDPRGD